jgi:hypothetical protein
MTIMLRAACDVVERGRAAPFLGNPETGDEVRIFRIERGQCWLTKKPRHIRGRRGEKSTVTTVLLLSR